MKHRKITSTIRGIKGLSIQDFAEKTGLSKSFISRVEKGERNLSKESIKQISNSLNIPEKFFDLIGRDSKNVDTKNAQEIGMILIKLLEDNGA